ncbi:MAG TPA: hypothetical protein VGW39_05810 [Chthoniobacterales bacterium]|nr:hypothetical protein [Chthoniobacterales bacterium]
MPPRREQVNTTTRGKRKSTIFCAVAWLAFSASAFPAGLNFAGVPFTPPATVSANVPLSDLEKSYVSEGGNAVPSHTVAVLAVPRGFDPKKTWPVLVVFSSSDYEHQNRDALKMLYRPPALAAGWVLIAGDGPQPARQDSSGWRAGHTLAALDAFNRSFPGSVKWPMVCVGHSGGAKRASYLAPLLAARGYRLTGIFLNGINEERITQGYQRFKPGHDFLRTPIFLNNGVNDLIATPAHHNEVEKSMRRTGFNNIRHTTFPGGHEVRPSQLEEALRWFRKGG